MIKETLRKIFGNDIVHIHDDVIELGYTYCKICGSPFSCVLEAKEIMQSKRETKRLNELLSKRKLPLGIHRVKSRRDHTRLPDPPGLTNKEESEFQYLQLKHFER